MLVSVPYCYDAPASPGFVCDLLTKGDNPPIRGLEEEDRDSSILRLLVVEHRFQKCGYWSEMTKDTEQCCGKAKDPSLCELVVMDGSYCLFLARLDTASFPVRRTLHSGTMLLVSSHKMIWMAPGCETPHGCCGYMLVQGGQFEETPLRGFGVGSQLLIQNGAWCPVLEGANFVFMEEYHHKLRDCLALSLMSGDAFHNQLNFLSVEETRAHFLNGGFLVNKKRKRDGRVACGCVSSMNLVRCTLVTMPVEHLDFAAALDHCKDIVGQAKPRPGTTMSRILLADWDHQHNRVKRLVISYWYAVNAFACADYCRGTMLPSCVTQRLNQMFPNPKGEFFMALKSLEPIKDE